MPIIMLFSVLSLVVIPMAIDLGESSNWLWNNSTDENGFSLIGTVYALALLVGAAALSLRLYCISEDRVEARDFSYSLIMGLLTTLSVFCFSYLYAFTSAPITSESGWLNGWLIYVVIGLLPVILSCNNAIANMFEHRDQV